MKTLLIFLQAFFSSLRFGFSPSLNIAACQQTVDTPIISRLTSKANAGKEHNQISFSGNKPRSPTSPETRNKDPTAGRNAKPTDRKASLPKGVFRAIIDSKTPFIFLFSAFARPPEK